MAKAREEAINVAEAKKQLSELLGRVAFRHETILITRRGRPMARLVPPDDTGAAPGLGAVKGWMADGDPFLDAIDDVVSARATHRPRALARPRGRRR